MKEEQQVSTFIAPAFLRPSLCCTSDAFWGTGKNGNGKNMLGKLLMEVRQELLSNNTNTSSSMFDSLSAATA